MDSMIIEFIAVEIFEVEMMRYVMNTFSMLGIIFSTLFLIGLILDVGEFDTTSGGYEPPYTDYTGEPVDWDSLDVTSTGLVNRGYIVNTHVNGTTGMISFEIFRQMIDFRPLSERALVIHKPREAFIRRGFKPEF